MAGFCHCGLLLKVLGVWEKKIFLSAQEIWMTTFRRIYGSVCGLKELKVLPSGQFARVPEKKCLGLSLRPWIYKWCLWHFHCKKFPSSQQPLALYFFCKGSPLFSCADTTGRCHTTVFEWEAKHQEPWQNVATESLKRCIYSSISSLVAPWRLEFPIKL